MLIAKQLANLLRRPFSRRMVGHVGVENASRVDLHYDEYIEDAERCCYADEKVAGDDLSGMVANERAPPLILPWFGRFATAKVLSDSSGGDLDPEFQAQLIGDALLAPSWVLVCNCSNEFLNIRRKRPTASVA